MAKAAATTRKRRKRMDNETNAPKTTEQKLDAAKALVAKLTRQLAQERVKNDIQNGDNVTFQFGRGDTKREMAGTVVGMADTDQGKIVAVQTLDDLGLPEVRKVNLVTILSNTSADARRTETPADAAPDNVDVDPLNVA